MTLGRTLILGSALVLVCSVLAQKDDRRKLAAMDLPPILKKAIAAFPKLRYTGVRIIEFKEGPERKRHTENVIRDGDKSRVEFPSTSLYAGQIIIEIDGKRLHYFPAQNEVHVLPARKEEAFGRAFRVLTHHRGDPVKVTTSAGEVVAGHRTEQAVISDKRGNVIERLYIEPSKGLILKREIFDRSGTSVGFFHFTQVNLNPRIDPAEFTPPFRGARRVTVEDLARRMARDNQMLPVMFPKGDRFRLEHARIIRFGGNPVFMQMYVGPKGRLSLFQTSGPIDKDRLARMQRGNVTAHAWVMRERNFVLVGDATAEELQKMARLLTGR